MVAKTQAGIDAEIEQKLPSNGLAGIPAADLRTVLHDMNTGIFQGSSGVSGLANPGAAAGLAAVPGTATTAMRSDGAPAISQAIAPTWTAPHIFANATASVSLITGAVTVVGGVGVSGAIWGGSINTPGAIASGAAGGASGTLTLNGSASGSSALSVSSTGNALINNASIQGAQRISATVTAVANTDFTLSIPAGASVLGITVFTTTAFTGTGTVQLQAGNAAGDASYAAAQDIKGIGVHVITLSATTGAAQGNLPAGTPNYFMRIAQSATPTAVGAAIIVVDYLLP